MIAAQPAKPVAAAPPGVLPLVVAALLTSLSPLAAGPASDPAAHLLDEARRAYREADYPAAAVRFREFLTRFSQHKDAAAAHRGLASALLHAPARDYAGAVEHLKPLSTRSDLHDHGGILYDLGVAQRGLALRETALAASQPQQAPQHRAAATARLNEASQSFAAALGAFAAEAGPAPAAGPLPADLERSARARCAQAEVEIRLNRVKQAQAVTDVFLRDPVLMRSRHRQRGRYYHGVARFALKEYDKATADLAPLKDVHDPGFGPHARYLLVRIDHATGRNRGRLAAGYVRVCEEFAGHRRAAAEALRQANKLTHQPDDKARLEALANGPVPDYVARAAIYAAASVEDTRPEQALRHLDTLVNAYPPSLLPDADLLRGCCQVRLGRFAEALRVLRPLADKEPRLADQALYWMGRAEAGQVKEAAAPARAAALQAAAATFRQAADRAAQAADPEAKFRRGEILVALAETQQAAGQPREAAATLALVVADATLQREPPVGQQALERQIRALERAGDYAAAEALCARFQQTYPTSPLLAAVLFRHAEAAALQAPAVEENAALPNRAQELARLNDEQLKRYQLIVDRFPRSPHANLARYGLAVAHARRGELAKARRLLEGVLRTAGPDQPGVAGYLLADCILRQLAQDGGDGTGAAARAMLRQAADLLDGFVNEQPDTPQTPDALMLLAECDERLAEVGGRDERAASLGSARAAYERLMQQYPKHPFFGRAVLGHARCLARAGDRDAAVQELGRFRGELQASPLAPLALLEAAELLRAAGKPAEAAGLLAECVLQHGAQMLADPLRAGWVPVIAYRQGVALEEAGRRDEARAAYQQAAQQFPQHAAGAEAVLRWAELREREGLEKIAAADKLSAAPAPSGEDVAATNLARTQGRQIVTEALQYLETGINQRKPLTPPPEPLARMYYEAAWQCRRLALQDVAAARQQCQQLRLALLQAEAAQQAAGKPVPAVRPPYVPLSTVPLQPLEQQARAHYEALLAAFPGRRLTETARLELAELLYERGAADAAAPLLLTRLKEQPPEGLADRLRLHLGLCMAARGDVPGALAMLDDVARTAKDTGVVALAHDGAARCWLARWDWNKAAARLSVFRDQPSFRRQREPADRALFCLGYALGRLGRWEESRQAYELCVRQADDRPLVADARYGIAWAWQRQGRPDRALDEYRRVAATTTEPAPRAQVQVGLVRLQQGRPLEAVGAFLLVPYTSTDAELCALALHEAARALTELDQPAQAAKVLDQLTKTYPQTRWAELARQRLAHR
jgi:tetratricopeptide (TPR) repeat protein